ncbi:glutamate--cysteine ligase [Thalassotalea nanhaiensis]|uniref:glutamate--cysteine ligase n=1 Tax=Thalassotalea nanhaiensis TaxID=3065648 RepID=UPI003866841A
MTLTFSILDLTKAFSEKHLSAVAGVQRGIERETLRIRPDGKLSSQSHNKALGSALTHEYITTDYSESLLEFITSVSPSIDETLNQLKDIQKFTLENVEGDYFWPMSMPCAVVEQDEVNLAQYGSSNIGKMKTVYRQGLKNRYGSMMQVIAGIHFNFSFSPEFFDSLQEITGDTQGKQDFISERYFSLIRNYKRFGWLIPYLYGSSPALCPSFLQGKPQSLPFKKAPAGCLYLEYATSLRMSDLGYTNSSQSNLHICNNHIDNYVEGVQKAINLPSEEFAKIGVKVDGKYQQLNSNILQIENELYAPIRPKRVAKSGQKPSEALKEGGVEYIEVRAMDVNPFVSTGISKEQMYFLDVFITFCMLKNSPEVTVEQKQVFNNNTNKVILEGRDPSLTLNDCGIEKTIPQWGSEIFSEMKLIASLYDKAYGTSEYSNVVKAELAKINDPTLTPSARIIDELLTTGKGIVTWSMDYVNQYNQEAEAHNYQVFNEDLFVDLAKQSLAKQQEIEAGDTLSFDEFLADYFEK